MSPDLSLDRTRINSNLTRAPASAGARYAVNAALINRACSGVLAVKNFHENLFSSNQKMATDLCKTIQTPIGYRNTRLLLKLVPPKVPVAPTPVMSSTSGPGHS